MKDFNTLIFKAPFKKHENSQLVEIAWLVFGWPGIRQVSFSPEQASFHYIMSHSAEMTQTAVPIVFGNVAELKPPGVTDWLCHSLAVWSIASCFNSVPRFPPPWNRKDNNNTSLWLLCTLNDILPRPQVSFWWEKKSDSRGHTDSVELAVSPQVCEGFLQVSFRIPKMGTWGEWTYTNCPSLSGSVCPGWVPIWRPQLPRQAPATLAPERE